MGTKTRGVRKREPDLKAMVKMKEELENALELSELIKSLDIKWLRLLFRMTQARFAKAMNVSPREIGRWEHKTSKPTLENLIKLRNLLLGISRRERSIEEC